MKTIHKGTITSKVSSDQEVNVNRILPLIGLLYLESIVHDQRRKIYSMVNMTSENTINGTKKIFTRKKFWNGTYNKGYDITEY